MRIFTAWLGLGLTFFASPGRAGEVAASIAPPSQARVVMVEDTNAMLAFVPQPQVTRSMMDRALRRFTGKEDIAAAWRTLVSTNDVVGLKVYCGPGPISGTRPAVVAAVVEGLLAAGLPSSNIVVWDRRIADVRIAYQDLADQYHIRLAATGNSSYDEKSFYDNPLIGDLAAGDLEFDTKQTKSGRKSYVTKLLTRDITKIITITPLLNHNYAGVTGSLYSLAMGSTDNFRRFEDAPDRLATAVPEIFALPWLSDHVVLCITDALLGQYQGESIPLLHYSNPLDQIWISKDPVALDTLGLLELQRERQVRGLDPGQANLDLYHNASLLELGVSDPAKISIDMVK